MADQKDFVVRSGIVVPNNSTFGANVAITNRLTTNAVVTTSAVANTVASNSTTSNTLTVLVSANLAVANVGTVNANIANLVVLSSNAVTINVLTATTGNVIGLGANVLTVNTATMNTLTVGNLNVTGTANLTIAQGQVFRGYREYVDVRTGVSGSTNMDLLNSNIFNFTLSANTTLTVSNVPLTGVSTAFTLLTKQPAGGGATITWPTGTVWSEGVAPVQSLGANQIDVFTFWTVDGGVMWIGAHSFANVS